MTKIKNSDNGVNSSNLLIRIKLLLAQIDPIQRRPLYQYYKRLFQSTRLFQWLKKDSYFHLDKSLTQSIPDNLKRSPSFAWNFDSKVS
jgi:hypothetical protein